MCLSIPSKVIAVDENNIATVDTMGVKRQVSLDLIDAPVKTGEYVLIHVGYAMNTIDEASALESLELYREMIERMEEDQGEEGELRSKRGTAWGERDDSSS